jgi:hypothetical protein
MHNRGALQLQVSECVGHPSWTQKGLDGASIEHLNESIQQLVTWQVDQQRLGAKKVTQWSV